MKDQFRKELKKQPVLRSGSEADVWVSTWQYYDLMTFLKDEVLPVPTTGNLQELEESQVTQDTEETPEICDLDSDSNISLASPQPQSSRSSSRPSSTIPSISLPKKRSSMKEDYLEIERKKLSLMEKRIEIQNNSYLDKDDDMLYFQSLLPSVKKLTHIQKLKLRGKINDWLLETLSQNEQNNTQNFQPVQGQVQGFIGYSQGPVLGTTGYSHGPILSPNGYSQGPIPGPSGYSQAPIPGPNGYSQGPLASGFRGTDEQEL